MMPHGFLWGFVGSGFYIEVALKYLHPAPILSPVNHSRQNELDSFTGDKAILERYCPYPMPVKHELYYKTHKVGKRGHLLQVEIR